MQRLVRPYPDRPCALDLGRCFATARVRDCVLFGSAPDSLKTVFRKYRSLLGQRWMEGASESSPDTMRQFREAGYDPIVSPTNSPAVIEENFRKWIGQDAKPLVV